MVGKVHRHLLPLAVALAVSGIGCRTLQVPFSIAAVVPWSDSRFQQEFGSARLLEQQSELLRAEQLYQGLARRYPNRPQVHQRLGVIAQKQGNKDESLVHLRRAKELSPLNTDVLGDLGYAEYLAGNYKQSVDTFRQAQELNPNHPRIQANLAIALVAAGDSGTAHQVFLQKLSEADAYTSMGFAFIQHGKMEEGRRSFEKAVQMDPHQEQAAEALVQLANVTSSTDTPNNQLAQFGVAVRDGSGLAETTGLTIIGEKYQREHSDNRHRPPEPSGVALATTENLTTKSLTADGFVNRSNAEPRFADPPIRNRGMVNQPGAMTQMVNAEYAMSNLQDERLRGKHDTYSQNRERSMPPYENGDRGNPHSNSSFRVATNESDRSFESHSNTEFDAPEVPRRLQIDARDSERLSSADDSPTDKAQLSNHPPQTLRAEFRRPPSSEFAVQAADESANHHDPDRSRSGVSSLLANSRGASPAQNRFYVRDVQSVPEGRREVPSGGLSTDRRISGNVIPSTQLVTHVDREQPARIPSTTDRWNEALQLVRASSNSTTALQTIAELLPSQSMTERIAAWKCLQNAGAKARVVGPILLELSSDASGLEAVESSFAIYRIYGWADYAEHRLRQYSASVDPEVRTRSLALLKCCR